MNADSIGGGPWRGRAVLWGTVLRQAGRDLWANNAMEWGAALAFYALLSLFPLLLAAAALAAYFVEPGWAVARLSALLAGFVPDGVVDVEPVVAEAVAARGRVGLLAIVAWVLAGRRIFGTLVTALNRVSDVDERRESLARRALVEVALLAGLGSLFVAAMSAGSLLGLLWDAGEGAGARPPAAAVGGMAIQLALLVATFYALYTFVPHGQRSPRAALIGAGAATILFLAARALFLLVLERLWDSFNLVYGPLAVAALLLLWGWYVGLIVLFGGSLASHVKVMLVEGRSAAEAERRHVPRKVPA